MWWIKFQSNARSVEISGLLFLCQSHIFHSQKENIINFFPLAYLLWPKNEMRSLSILSARERKREREKISENSRTILFARFVLFSKVNFRFVCLAFSLCLRGIKQSRDWSWFHFFAGFSVVLSFCNFALPLIWFIWKKACAMHQWTWTY